MSNRGGRAGYKKKKPSSFQTFSGKQARGFLSSTKVVFLLLYTLTFYFADSGIYSTLYNVHKFTTRR